MAVPLKTSANSAKSELLSETTSENLIPENLGPAISGQLAEVAKWYWVEQFLKAPVVVKIAERLEMPNNSNFAKVPKPNEEIANNKKILPYHKRADKRLGDIQKSVWQPLQYCKCLMQPFNISSKSLNLKRLQT